MRHTDLQRRRPRALLRDTASTLGHLGRVLLGYGPSLIRSVPVSAASVPASPTRAEKALQRALLPWMVQCSISGW